MKKLLIGLTALTLTACAASTSDLKFAPDISAKADSDDALLVLAVGPILTAGYFNFEPINAQQTGFEKGSATLSFGAYGSPSMLKRPEGESSSFWRVQTNQVNFLASPVKAGLYAATETSFNGFNGVSTIVNTSCRRDGAAAFVIEPGKINIIMLQDAFPGNKVSQLASTHTEDTVKDAFERTRSNYPDVKGDIVISPPSQEARWVKADDKFFGNACEDVADSKITLSNRRVGQDREAPDASDKAAIDAALSNLNK